MTHPNACIHRSPCGRNLEIVPGRYGPEYLVTENNLIDAGLGFETPGETPSRNLPAKRPDPVLPSPQAQETVPLALFQELQMKHEQLLVQYGMVRVAGTRMMELRAELAEKQRALACE